MKKILFALLLVSYLGFSQNANTSYEMIEKSENQYKIDLQKSIVKNIDFTNIGPSVMSGRVTDLEVNPKNTTEFYVAYASGGLWHTLNNGTTFNPIMDNSITQNIGDFDIDWNSRTIYVGTGESNSSRSSYPGIGILKSTDNGKTWTNVGLRDSHHISRVMINPENSDHVVVAVIGHLYSENEERGIFVTYDGGKNWNKSLFVNNNTGAIDLISDPKDFNIQYAAFWERSRTAWNFIGSGDDSGIYKTKNGGKTWDLITTENSGFPTGEGVGRIGLAIYDSNTLYSVVDNQFRREEKSTENSDLKRIDFKDMTVNQLLKLEDKKLEDFLRQNGFSRDESSKTIKGKIQKGQLVPNDLYKFLTDANAELFDTPVIGAEVYKSVDSGITWTKQNDEYLDGVYNSYGYYFGRIHVSPKDSNQIYIYGVPIIKSNDSGKTYTRIGASNVHVDHHDLWINPENTNHLVLGNDGGVNISYDQGENWIKLNQPSVGQFYAINVDNSEPYNVYGGLQDNGVWMAKNTSVESPSWYDSGHNNWTKIMGGDGMHIQIDSRDNNIVYTGLQFGNYYRLNLSKESRKNIKPKHKLGESPLRFNWQTPILISPHNQDIIYFGSNKLHRSFNKGDDWENISGDLTQGGKKGNVPYGTIASFDESIFSFGKIVVGSDDGKVILTENSGNTWKEIGNSLPKDLWVSRVIFSKIDSNKIYITLNGYRYNDFNPYVFVSTNNGETWKNISSNLPLSPVNVIREDINSDKVLYVGTDNGVFVSLDSGESWNPFSKNLNRVAVHDLVIHHVENDLLVGTHGRSIYKTNLDVFDNYIKKYKKGNDITVLDISELKFSRSWGRSANYSDEVYNEKVIIDLFSESDKNLEFSIIDEKGNILNNGDAILNKGFNTISILPIVNVEINEKKLKKMGSNFIKSADGNIYFPKGIYNLKFQNIIETSQIK